MKHKFKLKIKNKLTKAQIFRKSKLRRTKKAQKLRVKIDRSPRYALNPGFEFFQELRSLILKSSPAEKDKMIKKISGLGRVKLAIIAGIFLNSEDGMTLNPVADLFIVGDDINKQKLASFLRSLEAEVGKEIKFGLMEKDEFEYRFGMFDRFVRVLLEGPHEKIINKLGL